MCSDRENSPLSPAIRSALAALRWRVRLYVCLEGLSLGFIWLAVAFWTGLAVDYLPVLAGASEMPRAARAVALALVVSVFAWIVYRWVLRRVLVQLADPSVALVLERRFDRFRDSLVTAVEMHESPQHAAGFDRAMLARANEEAASQIRGVRLAQVLNLPPLLLKCFIALLLLSSFVLFYVANASAFEIWLGRMTLLNDRTWPRSARIAVAGVEVGRSSATWGQTQSLRLLPFQDRVVKVGKGADLTLLVRADAGAKVVPKFCTIEYATEDAERGRARMSRIGRPQSGFQVYRFDGRPFKGALSDVLFDIIGYDQRLRDFRIDVVANPVLVNPTVDCVFPQYMVDERLSSWLPRTMPLESGTELPVGTEVTIHAWSNKSLREVRLFDPDTKATATVAINEQGEAARRFSHRVGSLDGNLTLEAVLLDADNVVSERPYRFFIGAIEDRPPTVDVTLRGISTMVTPDVVMPARGKISDDYGLLKAWFEVQLNDGQPVRYVFAPSSSGAVENEIDFRETRSQPGGLELKPSHTLKVTVKASDKYNLGEAHVGQGDSFQLDVVTPDELIAHLEARELALRQRFELIIEEVTQTRDSLAWIGGQSEGSGVAGAEPEDAARQASPPAAAAQPANEETAAQRARALQRLRVTQAQRQSQKSSQEVLGVAAAFGDIREELINNRVDTEDRKQRLQEQIADPLQLVGEIMFPEFDRRLHMLEASLDDPSLATQAAEEAIQQANDILVELDKVLQRMLELETFNELIGLVRSLLQDQQELIKKTEQLRKKQALDFLR